ncbi:MAG TPA: hypothetical protein VEJ43_11195 [Pseudolabrys sp.]|nr:hypothetical protein [Pseudolabrys sp.]
MTKDWRLEQLEARPYLWGATFTRKSYRASSPEWDHDHCTACWTTLAESHIKRADIIHEGYATTAEFVRGADYSWICVACFEQFRDIMEWRDVTTLVSG